MRIVVWEDRRGWKHRSLVRDDDPDEAAPGGILQDPPDLLNGVDWEEVARDLHNHFINQNVATWRDLQRTRSLTGAIQSAVKRRVIMAFKFAELSAEDNHGNL